MKRKTNLVFVLVKLFLMVVFWGNIVLKQNVRESENCFRIHPSILIYSKIDHKSDNNWIWIDIFRLQKDSSR